MGHFKITLPGKQEGNVRWGTIRRKSLFVDLFKAGKRNNEIKKGYIVTIGQQPANHKEYRLLKTKEGEWTSSSDEGFKVTPEDKMSVLIKHAIDDYENQ